MKRATMPKAPSLATPARLAALTSAVRFVRLVGAQAVAGALCVACVGPKGTSEPENPTGGGSSSSAPEAEIERAGEAQSVPSPWIVSEDPDLRELTVMVRVTPPAPLVAAYTSLAERFVDWAPVLLGHAQGGFGSGFVVLKRPESEQDQPTAYVITNQHVVGLAENAEVHFDGVETAFASQVVFVDEEYDLAILRIEHGEDALPVDAGLSLETLPASDQDTVIAAGFPGIAGHPSYQVTRGYVSNHRVLLPLDGTPTPHIQHTAPIDPGSSGGPLLSERGRVLGINTMKVRDREGVGLAVPSEAITAALLRSEQSFPLDSSTKNSSSETQAACDTLVQLLVTGESIRKVERSLSASTVADHGPGSLGVLPPDHDLWIRRFADSPEDVLIYALALRLRQEVQSSLELAPPRCAAAPDSAQDTFELKLKGKSIILAFRREQARIKLASVTLKASARANFLTTTSKRSKKWTPSLR